MPNASLDCLGLGQCCVDQVVAVDALPGPDSKAEYDEVGPFCGGPAATALYALARWGRRVAMAGIVGDDLEGQRIRAELTAVGVDCEALRVRLHSRSQSALVAVENGSGRRMILWRRATGAAPTAAELDRAPPRVFLTDGLYAEASLAMARRAPLTVVDAGTLREGTRALLGEAGVFVASESFARALVGEDDPRGACRRIREHGAAVAGVTLGERGYVASVGHTWLERPALPVDAVDTTGCGDVFHAMLVEGVLAGWSWPTTFERAAWAAACCATRLGGRAGIPELAAYPALPAGGRDAV